MKTTTINVTNTITTNNNTVTTTATNNTTINESLKKRIAELKKYKNYICYESKTYWMTYDRGQIIIFDAHNKESAQIAMQKWFGTVPHKLVPISGKSVGKLYKTLAIKNNLTVSSAQPGDVLSSNEKIIFVSPIYGDLHIKGDIIENLGKLPEERGQIIYKGNYEGYFTGDHKCRPHTNDLFVWFRL